MDRPFAQVDVFADEAISGNPVAVVLDGAGLSDAQMQRLAHWTNLSETTFVLPPESPEADYRVRIFTPTLELPFAGHPTLGTCHAWLEHGGTPRREGIVVQECGVGLVTLRRGADGLAFAAPPRRRSGPVAPELLEKVVRQLGIAAGAVVDAEWLDNGVPWIGVMLGTVEELLAVRPGVIDEDIGVVALTPERDTAYEVRAFFPKDGATVEDPVTGSLNAAVAQWLIESGSVASPYTVAQGTVLGRRGRVRVDIADGEVWIGGGTITVVAGSVTI